MKKFRKYIYIFALLLLFFSCKTAYAKELNVQFADFYYDRKGSSGIDNSWNFPKYSIAGDTSYCIRFEVLQGSDYVEASWNDMGLKDSIKERLLLIAYYGYDYPGHQTDKYLAATQALLWELTASEKVDVTFNTGRFNSGTDISVAKERNEIEELISHHFDKPVLDNLYIVNFQSDLVLYDELFKNYYVTNADGISAKIVNNQLFIHGTQKGEYTIKLQKKQVYDKMYSFMSSPNHQNMLVAGNLEPYEISFKVRVTSGNVIINKKDIVTDKNIINNNVTFKVYDVVKKAYTVTTDDNGIATLNNIPYGVYYIEEVNQPINGYIWNNNKVYFDLNSNVKNINFYNTPVMGKINIQKYGEELILNNGVIYDNIPLGGVEFVLKAKEDIFFNSNLMYSKDDLVATGTTDNNGKLSFDNLFLGEYYFYESSTDSDYVLDDKIYYASLSYLDQYTEIVEYDEIVYNELYKGDILITKRDFFDNSLLDGVRFALYKNNETLLECTTLNGLCLFSNIPYGDYIIKEINGLDGYYVNDEDYKIDLNVPLVELDIYNERIIENNEIYDTPTVSYDIVENDKTKEINELEFDNTNVIEVDDIYLDVPNTGFYTIYLLLALLFLGLMIFN